MHSDLTMRFVLVFKMTAWGWAPGVGRLRGIMMVGKARVVGVLVAVSLVLAGCSSGDISNPTTTDPTISSPTTAASSASSPQSTVSAAPSSSVALSITTPVAPSSNPWPSTLTVDQATGAAAAIAAYVALWQVVDQAFAAPGEDWSAAVAAYATASAQSSLLEGLTQTSARGQRRVGSTKVTPQVTSAETGLVTITDCVDSTGVDILNSAGESITAPDAPGAYRRHVSTAHVTQVETGQWLVSDTAEDWSTAC